MSFSTMAEFLAMGRHGVYVWSAYGVFVVVLAINVIGPWWAHRRYRQGLRRRQRREGRS